MCHIQFSPQNFVHVHVRTLCMGYTHYTCTLSQSLISLHEGQANNLLFLLHDGNDCTRVHSTLGRVAYGKQLHYLARLVIHVHEHVF